MTRISFVGLLVVVLAGVAGPAQGQGWYLGSALGAHVVPDLGMTGLSNDRASVCDEFINPQYATVTQTAGYDAYACTGPDRSDDWVNQFARAMGLQTGWVLGYRFGAGASGPRWRHLRTEVEYVYRATAYDQTVAVPGLSAGSGSVTADKLNQELQTATDYLGRVTAHTLFANLYWDVRTRSRFTPYAGVGVGYGSTAVTYGSLWSRNANPAAITTGEGLPNADDIRQNLAATTSSFQGALSDRLVSQQVLGGVDYALTDGLSVGVKGRWVHAGAFESAEALVLGSATQSRPQSAPRWERTRLGAAPDRRQHAVERGPESHVPLLRQRAYPCAKKRWRVSRMGGGEDELNPARLTTRAERASAREQDRRTDRP